MFARMDHRICTGGLLADMARGSGGAEAQVSEVFAIVQAYLNYRSKQGLRRVYLEYENWLREQDWYSPNDPLWFGIEGK